MIRTTEHVHVVALPVEAKSRAGVTFNPNDHVWHLRDAVVSKRFDFSSVRGIAPGLVAPLKAVLLWYAMNTSLCHSAAMFNHFKMFFGTLAKDANYIEEITGIQILNYRSALGKERACDLLPRNSPTLS